MSKALENYKQKLDELKAMGDALASELTAEVTQYLKNLGDTVVKLKEISPKFNLDELAEWKGLVKHVGITATKWEPPTAKRGPKKGATKAAKGDLTPTEQKIFNWLGKDGKKNGEINKHFKMANSSVNTSKMKAKGFIVKKDGKWFPK